MGRCMLSLTLRYGSYCTSLRAALNDRPFFPRGSRSSLALVDLGAWRRGQEQPVASN